jgi:drug/metabolite transporter (DMT)-like permease
MWLEVLLLIPIAIFTNTALPVPFDPLLMIWAQSGINMFLLALTAALCAGIGSILDVRLARALGRNNIRHGREAVALYCATFVCALLPLPFSIIRVSLIQWTPSAILFAVVVTGGRFPRYLLILHLGRTLPVSPLLYAVPLFLLFCGVFLRKQFAVKSLRV